MADDLRGEPQARAGATRQWVALGVLAAIGGLGALGAVTSLAFNVALGRVDGFGVDPPTLYWSLGLRSLVAPAFAALTTALFIRLVMWVARLVGPWFGRTMPPGADPRRWWSRIERASAASFAQIAERIVVLQILLAALVCITFQSVLVAVTSYLTDADPTLFEPLRPENYTVRNWFSLSLSIVIFLTISSWVAAIRGADPSSVRRAWVSLVAGGATLAMTFAILVLPYRLTWQNKFERAQFEGFRCYLISTRPPDVLAYCPDRERPRVRTIRADDPRIQRLGFIESIFTPAASAGSDTTTRTPQ